jgi:hypothetical protein
MEQIVTEAKILLNEWYETFGFSEESIFCTNHQHFKSILGHYIFTDKELILEINKQGDTFLKCNNIKLIDFVTTELKNDKDFILELIKVKGSNLSLLKEEFKDDEEIVWAAIKSEPEIFACASERLRDNDDIVDFVLKKYPKAIKYTSDRFKNNKIFVSKLIKSDFSLLPNIHDDIKNDLYFLLDLWKEVKLDQWNDKLFNYRTAFLLNNMGKQIKPFFEPVDPDLEVEDVIMQMESCFNNLILQKELSSSQNKHFKKMKL